MIFRKNCFDEILSSQLDSHRNSVHNGMVEKLNALMATIFVTNFRFYVTATFADPDSQKRRRRKNVRAGILGRMHRSAYSQLSRGPFCVTISVFVSRGNFQATFGHMSSNFWTTFRLLSGNFRATIEQHLGNFLATFGKLSDIRTISGQLLLPP